jgi:hypothetical protein
VLRSKPVSAQKKHQYDSRASQQKLIVPVIFEGNCDKNVFESYVEQILIKELEPAQIIVMDNINFHKSPKVLKAIAGFLNHVFIYLFLKFKSNRTLLV